MASQRQIEANRRNRRKWRGHTPDGLVRLRASARRNQPWRHSTGPRTPEGKAKAAQNGRRRGRVRKEWELLRLLHFMGEYTRMCAGLKPRRQLVLPAGCDSPEYVVGRIRLLGRELGYG